MNKGTSTVDRQGGVLWWCCLIPGVSYMYGGWERTWTKYANTTSIPWDPQQYSLNYWAHNTIQWARKHIACTRNKFDLSHVQ